MTDDSLAIKYLEFVQEAITRIGGQSFLIKGWNVTLGTAIIGFAEKEELASLAALGLIPVALFWWLDAYYLTLERGFRRLFNSAVAELVAAAQPAIDMKPDFALTDVARNAFRPAVAMVHVPMILLMGALALGWVSTG